MITADIQLVFDWWGVAAKLLPIIFLIVTLTILYEIWENKEHDRKLRQFNLSRSMQTLHWYTFQNTSELDDGCWYLFTLRNGGYIVEQYDEELNWRFYVPHTDYIDKFAQLTYVNEKENKS